MGWIGMGMIRLAKNTDQWQDFVNAVVNLRYIYNISKF
jgi:hypothetical protein